MCSSCDQGSYSPGAFACRLKPRPFAPATPNRGPPDQRRSPAAEPAAVRALATRTRNPIDRGTGAAASRCLRSRRLVVRAVHARQLLPVSSDPHLLSVRAGPDCAG
eukprot:3737457-Prymnesium_polylepis.1